MLITLNYMLMDVNNYIIQSDVSYYILHIMILNIIYYTK